jgi:hypothetical protein
LFKNDQNKDPNLCISLSSKQSVNASSLLLAAQRSDN